MSQVSWRLQDAKAQFSAVVESALRGVPQHVTRRGKEAVVVVSEQDFAALQRSAHGNKPGFLAHLMAIPKPAPNAKAASGAAKADGSRRRADASRAALALREVDF